MRRHESSPVLITGAAVSPADDGPPRTGETVARYRSDRVLGTRPARAIAPAQVVDARTGR